MFPSIKGRKIGVIRNEFNLATDSEVLMTLGNALKSMEALGLILEDVELEDYPYQEIARYTLNIEAATVFEPLWKTGRIDMLINKQRATDWSAARLLPATDYLKMQRLRTEICEYAARLLKDYVALVAPSLISPAGPVEPPNVAVTNPTAITAGGGSLAFGNITGLPAVSVPCGFTVANLPLGLQLIGSAFDEETLLRIAYAYQQVNPWHERHPQL